MLYNLAADAVVSIHFGFIVFVLFGGVLAFKWPRVVWLHIPAAIWGAVVEIAGWVCPLTPLENRLRAAAGTLGYPRGFIDHYITPLVYPPGLNRTHGIVIGITVILVNAAIYGILILQHKRRKTDPAEP